MRIAPLFFTTLVLGLVACDKIDAPDNPKPTIGPCTGNGYGFRRVLLEDLTGFRCPNCPLAGEKARELESYYCGDLIVVGLHLSSTFASPTTTPPAEFSTDFRTAAGEAYLDYWQVPTLPRGFVSRRVYNATDIIEFGDWASASADILGTPAQFEVVFDTVHYNTTSHQVDMTIKVPVLMDVTGDHDLTIYLLEDSIVEGQYDGRVDGGIVHNFMHRHVLRDNINGTWGETIFTGSATAGDTATVVHSYTLPATILDPAHCYLVAYIYRTDTKEVMQVSERKIIP